MKLNDLLQVTLFDCQIIIRLNDTDGCYFRDKFHVDNNLKNRTVRCVRGARIEDRDTLVISLDTV